jgi:hypothetical protein
MSERSGYDPLLRGGRVIGQKLAVERACLARAGPLLSRCEKGPAP